jgi:hypothetical protein
LRCVLCPPFYLQMEEKHRRMQATIEAERQARLARMLEQAEEAKRRAADMQVGRLPGRW